jgi:hypothetical protein
MSERLLIQFDGPVRTSIAAEMGSMNIFLDRLAGLVNQESGNRASISESSESPGEVAVRGGEVIEIITAVSALITALSPVVIAWIRSHGFVVEERTETKTDGTVIRSVQVRQGSLR